MLLAFCPPLRYKSHKNSLERINMSSRNKTIDKDDPGAAKEFNDIATRVFAPIYPAIAGMALERCGIKTGTCLELGCGPALLSVAMAKITDMNFIALDHSPPMLSHARDNIAAAGLTNRITVMEGDVHDLPAEDNTIDLVISRGSILFWEDKPAAFNQIRRVMKKGAKSFIGCGMGSKQLKEQVFEAMRKIDQDWDKNHQNRSKQQAPQILSQAAQEAGFSQFNVNMNDAGIWMFIHNI